MKNKALYEWLDSFEEDYELCVGELCDQFRELADVEEVVSEMSWDLNDIGLYDLYMETHNEEDWDNTSILESGFPKEVVFEAVRNALEEHTTVVCFKEGCIVYKDF
ncbi:MAG: hypothetical protein RBQ99_01700 [Trichlorobacter sp.]|nr:hypothetical protein [Trichlorobacter sp.]